MVVLAEERRARTSRPSSCRGPPAAARALRHADRLARRARVGAPRRPAAPSSPRGCTRPTASRALLRRLRVLNFAGRLLDDPRRDRPRRDRGRARARRRSRTWVARPEVEAALRADMRGRALAVARLARAGLQARRPARASAATRARATSSSAPPPPPADWPTAGRVDLPGFRPVEAYEAAIANLAPELTRRPDPGVGRRGARLGRHAARHRRGRRRRATATSPTCARSSPASARFEPVGGDGYWSLA